MGDRVLVIFHDQDDNGKTNEVSPTVYLHWSGSNVLSMIAELSKLMEHRKNDASYAAARFTGIAHVSIEGNSSLGVFETDRDLRNALLTGDVESVAKNANEMSHGDAGVILVNCKDFTYSAFGGYLNTDGYHIIEA